MDHKKIEKKWQKRWDEKKAFAVKEKGKKFYCLEMFPYPSGKLHMGHVRNYSIGDSFARFKRMQGFNVLYPMGYDSFGLPAENAAIKGKTHPAKWIESTIKSINAQQKMMGLSYDWNRLIVTSDPDYYKWNQWLFLKFLKMGLAYKKKAPINWCPSCETVLANEQVEHGKCWRCKSDVEIKDLEQWFLRITQYADELLNDIEKLKDWPERVKMMQINWIGRSEGCYVKFELEDGTDIPVFTTRPDTLWGATFLVFAPEHPMVMKLVRGTKYEKPVKEFIKKVMIQDKFTRTDLKSKEGLFIGKHAINPVNGEKIPIYIANFVLMEYGTGVIMSVPAHDQRDFEFAKKYIIPMKVVIQPDGKDLYEQKMKQAYVDEGILVNSGEFDGMNSSEAISKIIKWLSERKQGKKTIQYKLRDWLISRQRYWGTPIPIIRCEKCGNVPVPEKDLPVELPKDVKFTGHGNPLASVEKFVRTKCPKCKGSARRETDTMDTFFDSCWYFIRYCDPKNKKLPFDSKKANFWTPVDRYIGGIEHAILHFMYARFFTKVLRDLKLVKMSEPFSKVMTQGMVLKDGAKMSKSIGNIVGVEEITNKYGADTARWFMLSVAGPVKDLEWNDQGIFGAHRFLVKIHDYYERKEPTKVKNPKDKYILSKLNSTIKHVTLRMEELKMNLATKELGGFINEFIKLSDSVSPLIRKECNEKIVLMLNPFVPHLSEELWGKLGNKEFSSLQTWPKYDAKKINMKVEREEGLVREIISDVKKIQKLAKITKPSKVTIFVSVPWKYKVYNLVMQDNTIKQIMQDTKLRKYGKQIASYVQRLQKHKPLEELFLTAGSEHKVLKDAKDTLAKELGCEVFVKESDKSNHPKAQSAEPGKPGILVE